MHKADLHIHTKYSSDGEFEVSEIVQFCREKGLDTFTISDHNSVKGNRKAAALVQQEDMNFVPGIEIDCVYNGINLHVLGYNVDYESPDFEQLEDDVFAKTMDSFGEMIQNITRLGFVIEEEAVLRKAKGGLPTGELIAEVMLQDKKYFTPLLAPYMSGGNRSDMPYINFYLDYFAQGKPAFVPVEYMDYRDAIMMIRNNGGTPIIAHPGLNLKGRERIVEELLDNGADGLEVFNNYHSITQISYFASVVQSRNAVMTCGSDFHGKTKPLIAVGQYKYDKQYDEYLNSSIAKLIK